MADFYDGLKPEQQQKVREFLNKRHGRWGCPPPERLRRSPTRGQHQRPGKAGSAVFAGWRLRSQARVRRSGGAS